MPLLLCGTLLVVTLPRTASTATRKGRPTGRRVELVMARPAEDVRQFEVALRAILVAKGLGLASAHKQTLTPEDVALATTATSDQAASLVARVFMNFSAPGHATLFLIDPRRGRVHVRRIMLDRGFDAVARESTLFMVEQSINAILEGREIGMTREEFERSVVEPLATSSPPRTLNAASPPGAASPPSAPPPPGVPPLPAAPPSSRAPRQPGGPVRLLLAGGYEGVVMGAGAYQHAAKVVMAARFARFQVAAATRIAAPLSVAGDGVQARLWAAGVSVSGAARFLSPGNVSVRAGLGGGLDITRVDPAVTEPDLQAAAAFWARGPSLRTFLEIERLFGNIALTVLLGAEAHLLTERYTVRTGSGTRDVFVPRRLRPESALLVGVMF